MGPKTNSKVVAAMAKKEAVQAVKNAQAAAETERQTANEWKVGANNRKAARDDSEAEKEAEKARKKAEMAALLAEEDAATGAIKAKPKKIKKKDDLGALLSEGLAKAPKTKAQKEDDARKKAKEDARKKQAAEEAAAASKKPDPLALAPLVPNSNRESFFDGDEGGLSPRTEGGLKEALKAEEIVSGSGLDGALAALQIAKQDDGGVEGGAKGGLAAAGDAHPEKRRKAMYAAFEDRMMPQLREDYPGLKMSQYKDKLFKLWEKSPENPTNMNR